jgi:prolyl oligopeptidase
MTSADPYRWLEHAESPSTAAWTAQHEAAYERAASAWPRRESFAVALAGLSARFTRYGTPRPAGGRSFLTDKPPGAEHPCLAVAEPDGTLRVLLDPMLLAPDGSATLEHWEPSPDGRRLAYQIAAAGTEDSDLYVLDVDSGKPLDGPIDRVRRSTVAWLPDASAFYYVRRLGSDRYHRRVRYHVVGTDPDTDPMVFGEDRERTQFYATQVSADGRWLAVRASAGTDRNTEFWLADLSTRTPEALPVHRPRRGARPPHHRHSSRPRFGQVADTHSRRQ